MKVHCKAPRVFALVSPVFRGFEREQLKERIVLKSRNVAGIEIFRASAAHEERVYIQHPKCDD